MLICGIYGEADLSYFMLLFSLYQPYLSEPFWVTYFFALRTVANLLKLCRISAILHISVSMSRQFILQCGYCNIFKNITLVST